MMRFFRRKKDPLVKIVEALQSEEEQMINNLCRQVEDTLNSLPPEEALKMIASLRGETK